MRLRAADRLFMTAVMAGITLFPAMAQSLSPEQQQEPANPVEMIEETSGGNVEIDIPDSILEDILKEEKKRPRANVLLCRESTRCPATGYRCSATDATSIRSNREPGPGVAPSWRDSRNTGDRSIHSQAPRTGTPASATSAVREKRRPLSPNSRGRSRSSHPK